MMDHEKSTRGRRRPSKLWRDAIATEQRSERARVVPWPLALAAVMLPFFAAWAAAEAPVYSAPVEPTLVARELPLPLRALGRADRAADQVGAYVDVWGRTAPWEADALRRRGYVRPGH